MGSRIYLLEVIEMMGKCCPSQTSMIECYTVEAGDKRLGEHLKKALKNASYISKTTQNEILSLSADVIKERIVSMAKEVSFYSS